MSAAKGLGWVPGQGTAPQRFQLSAVVARAHEAYGSRYWYANGWWGDQGQTSQCVIYSWLHALHDSPLTRPGTKPLADPLRLYREGQSYDGTHVSDIHSGLTMDAGAKVMRRHGWIGEYRWANDVDEVLDALAVVGQVAIGGNWMQHMDEPDADGLVRYAGKSYGGHQFIANGFTKRMKLVRCKNSWGRTWGKRGYFYLPFDDLAMLLRDDGAACVARELPTPSTQG